MPLKLDPFMRLLRLLGSPTKFANVGQSVDRAFAASMKGAQVKQAMSRKIVRTPSGSKGGSEFKVKGDPKRVQRTLKAAKGGRVTSRWNYWRSLGHLSEDAAARSDPGRSILVTNPNKSAIGKGLDLGYLSFDKKSRMVVIPDDAKAQQAATRIGKVSAQDKNLATNLRQMRADALAAARDKTRPYGERVLFRAVSMSLNKTLNSNPKSTARSISAALKRRTLRLEVSNDGGNATGLSAKLWKKMNFMDRRFFKNGIAQINKFRHGLIPNDIRKQYGLSGNTTMQRFPSRRAELTRRRGTPSVYRATVDPNALQRLRSRLAAGSKTPSKPARPVGTRTTPGTATGQKASKPVGSRGTTKKTATAASGKARPIGPRTPRAPRLPGGTGGSKRGGIGGGKAPRAAPMPRPFGKSHGRG